MWVAMQGLAVMGYYLLDCGRWLADRREVPGAL